jgi:uncharacterized membrane protein
MSQVTPDERHDATAGAEGKPAALAVWVLHALAPLTGGLSAIVGVVVAYTQKARSSGLVRTHFETQIRLFWSALIWTALFTVAWGVSLALTTLFIGIPLVFLFWAAMVLLGIWFTVKSVLGALALSADRAP